MKKLFLLILISIWGVNYTFCQSEKSHGMIETDRLLDSLWIHPSSFLNHSDPNWIRLNQHLQYVDILQLNELIHSIFYGSNSFILNRSHAYEGFIGSLNKTADSKKMRKFHKKIRNGFRDPELFPDNKVVLVEGDSWFEYPIFLRDISDFLEKDPNLAIYTLAHGGDWVANMLSNLQYEYDYVKIKPDVFIISGGGNDMVGDYRLSNFLLLNPLSENNAFIKSYRNYVMLRLMKKPASICDPGYCNLNDSLFLDSITLSKQQVDTVLLNQIVTGQRYLNKNFYRFLVTLKLEYKMVFESLRKVNPEKFNSVKIITQGYDYAIPSYKKRFGIRMFMDNGEWLKEPLMMNGINTPYIQQCVLKTIVFSVNEMLIELGKEYNNVYHVDSRGITEFYDKYKGRKPGSSWYDELHPKSKIFGIIAQAYSDVINDKIPAGERVFRVKDSFLKLNQ